MTGIELPRWDARPGDAERGIATIDAWAAGLVASGLLQVFGTDAPAHTGADLLDFLDRFSSKQWDFRAGRERNLALAPLLSPAQLAAIRASVGPLGLDGTPRPRRSEYDAVVMTGGMVRAGIVKPRYLRELTDAGLGWREAVFLGAFRPFSGDEHDLAVRLGVDGDNEFDAMTTGMRQAFTPVGEPTIEEHSSPGGYASWRVETWGMGEAVLRVVAAPSSDPRARRANTVDTYRFWAGRAASVSSVLVITTPVYVPYQGAGAIEVLGLEYGFSVETVAVSNSASDLGENSQLFRPHHRLQELRSAIRGMRSLRSRLVVAQ